MAEDECGGSEDRTDAQRLRDLHGHLLATAERPLTRSAERWLGEAEAVAADVARGDAPEAAVETRLAQVRDLLSNVEETGDADADEHLAAAREVLGALEDSG